MQGTRRWLGVDVWPTGRGSLTWRAACFAGTTRMTFESDHLHVAHHPPIAFECSGRGTRDGQRRVQMNVTARTADHQLELARLDDTITAFVREIEHIDGQTYA